MLKMTAKLTILLSLAAGVTHLSTARPSGAQTLAPPQPDAIDPFRRINADLARAIDLHLERTREAERHAQTERPHTQPYATGSVSDSFKGTLAGLSSERVTAARQRLLDLGVDAAHIFAEEGVPQQLLVVAEVESNYNPLALSPKGARGVWQLMPETAARFGLQVDGRIDERIHPVLSTRAAARYLRELYSQFGDWLLALAAYNTGEKRVAGAIQRARVQDFWALSARKLLPEETRRYVPAVLRLMDFN